MRTARYSGTLHSDTLLWCPNITTGRKRNFSPLGKNGSGGRDGRCRQGLLEEISFAHMTKKTAETKTRDTNNWIIEHVRRRRGYKHREAENSYRNSSTSRRR